MNWKQTETGQPWWTAESMQSRMRNRINRWLKRPFSLCLSPIAQPGHKSLALAWSAHHKSTITDALKNVRLNFPPGESCCFSASSTSLREASRLLTHSVVSLCRFTAAEHRFTVFYWLLSALNPRTAGAPSHLLDLKLLVHTNSRNLFFFFCASVQSLTFSVRWTAGDSAQILNVFQGEYQHAAVSQTLRAFHGIYKQRWDTCRCKCVKCEHSTCLNSALFS